ncbi:MAG: hypothetical protein EYC70_11260 [Planctomycetota bacterium]|nr:MAG: hypothetical protein EYC70_11260 [Planctomycetota bacterium]
MRVAFGLKAHSGWAALVVGGERDGDFVVADRRRLELVDDEWTRQPYHVSEDLQPKQLAQHAEKALRTSSSALTTRMAALAARVALQGRS